MPLAGGTFSGDVTFDGATAGYDIVWDKSDNALEWADNAKAKFGTGGDLEIFHNASNSVINDAGTGDLLLQVGGTTQATISSTGVVIANNLTVSGTTTTVDSVTLSVKDKNIEMGVVSSPSDTTADGGGITLKGASDKTFNWVNSTDAWTSSEHIHLIDNKKLFVGGASGTVDGLEIVHNGSNSILNDSGTGTLQLQLGGSTKLEVQSGGINVTGAISVNGAALASGNTFTAVANGSIANNKAVKMDTDGKVSEIKTSLSAITGQPPGYSVSITDSSAHDIVRNSWNANQNKMVLLHRFTSGAGGTLGVRVGTIGTSTDSSSFTVGGIQSMCTTPGDDAAVGYDPNSYQHLFVYNDTSKTNNKLCARLGTISGTGMTYGTQVDLYTANTSGFTPSVMYDDSNDKFIVVYRNSSFKLTAVVGTVSGTNISFSSPVASTDSHTMYDGSNGMVATFDTDQNKVLAVFRNASNSNRLDYCVGSISSGSISWGTIAQLSSTQVDFIVIAFGATNNKFMIAFRGTSDNNYGRVMSAKIDSGATTVTAGSEFYIRSAETTSGRNIKGKSIAWDSASNRFAIWAVNTNLSNERAFISYLTDASGTGSGQPITQQGARGYENVTYSDSHRRMDIASMGSYGRFVTVGMRTSDLYARYAVYNAVEEASTLTSASYYVGFVDQAYTNGQTATIKTYGNHVDTLSGLTVGTDYYVRKDGTVGTSTDFSTGFLAGTPYAGVAISSSKLIIQHPSIMAGL